MKTKLYLLTISIVSSIVVSAQQMNIEKGQYLIQDFIENIEKQTDYKVYCNPYELDSQFVWVENPELAVPVMVQEALTGTGFKVSIYQKNIFLLSDKEIITNLPESFYPITKNIGLGEAELSDFSLLTNRQRQKATSENIIYEIEISPIH